MRTVWNFTAFTLAFATVAVAQGRSQEELLALPRVCLAQKFIHQSLRYPVVPEGERMQWAQSLGPAYEAFHHFCWGLIDMRRASTAEQAARRAYHYGNAVGNFDYVVRNADASFPMLPEVLLRKGMALRLLERDEQAATAFTDAIRVKQNYTPAYAALFDLYIDLDDLDGAQDVLERGLREAPESHILVNKKAELETLMK